MPDIKSALMSALSDTLQEWDDDGEIVSPPSSTINTTINKPLTKPTQGIPMTKTFGVTNNISRVSFEYIKNNPGSTRKEIIEALNHQGFNSGSTSSLIAQMRRNKMIHENNGLHYADIEEYRPLKSLKAIRKMEGEPTPKRKYEKKAVTGIGALLREKLANTPMPSQAALDAAARAMAPAETNRRFTSLVRNREPQDVLKDMTVYQAHELYVHLKQMFGG